MIGRWLERAKSWMLTDIPHAEVTGTVPLPPMHVPLPMVGHETVGYVVGSEHGLPIWVGHPDRTDSPTMTVYDDVTRVRRRLTSIFKGTMHATGYRLPLTVVRVRIVVERVSDPIVPKLRGDYAEEPDTSEPTMNAETLPLPLGAPHE